VALIVARLTFQKVAVYVHGEELRTWGTGKKYQAMGLVLRYVDFIIANSKFTVGELEKLRINKSKIHLINPGVDVEKFRPGLSIADLRQTIGLKGAQLLLLSVGRLSRRKGFDTVIRCLEILSLKGIDTHYAIIGIGEDQQYLEALARDLNVSGRTHFLGHVSSDDLPRWYNACDLFVMPNRDVGGDTEGFGLVFLEAAACGKASLAGCAGGTAEAVIHEVTGMRVDGDSVSGVADALRTLLDDEELRLRLGRAGRSRVLADLSWDQVAKRTDALART